MSSGLGAVHSTLDSLCQERVDNCVQTSCEASITSTLRRRFLDLGGENVAQIRGSGG